MLEGLLKATDGMEYDRSNIYYYLLLHYWKTDETRKALELRNNQCDENEKPTNIFLQTLASYFNEVPEGRAKPIQRAAVQKIPSDVVEKPKPKTPTLPPKQSIEENKLQNAPPCDDADAAHAW